MRPIDAPLPLFDARALPVTMIVFHDAPAADPEAAVARWRDPAARSSVHYLVCGDGRILSLVAEDDRAHHCGRAHWRGLTDIDSASIGIAISPPGEDATGLPDAQLGALLRLVSEVKDRHQITRGNVVGHSDVAPARARCPGLHFPWGRLARLRLSLPRPTRGLMDPHWNEASFLLALERFGYNVSDPRAAIMAFQRRFRPEMIDGEVDAECRMILLALLLPQPQGD